MMIFFPLLDKTQTLKGRIYKVMEEINDIIYHGAKKFPYLVDFIHY